MHDDASAPEIVAVTGGSAGVGRAIVREFAKHGAWIGVLARGRERLDETVREVERLGGRAISVPTDVADPNQVERAAEEIEERLGPIGVWINNAMTSVFSPFLQMSAEEYRRVTEVTYLGSVYGTLSALRRMYPRNRGTIVQISSALAFRGIPLQSAYCGAKHGIGGFLDSIHCELIHDKKNIHLTAVHLPAVNTPQFEWVLSRMKNKSQPVPPIYQPEVIARAAYFAAHSRRRDITVGRSAVKAIVADRYLPPRLIDHYLSESGYTGQQTDEPADPNQPFNLWEPVPGSYAAHGRFDDRAADWSLQFWLNKHRGAIAFSLLAAATAFAGLRYWNTARTRIA